MTPPTFAGISSSMSPEQQRARIASIGTQGQWSSVARPKSGPYAQMGVGDALQNYYRQIVMSSLTDPQGSPVQGGNILPVERQYIEQLTGNQLRDDSIGHFLSQLYYHYNQ
jgi:hypothetical protein